MHSFDSKNGYRFHFNGDYSGEIYITHPEKEDYELDADALMQFARYALTDKLVEHIAKFWDK